LLARRRLASQAEARIVLQLHRGLVQSRLRSALGYRSPITYKTEEEATLINA